VRVGLQDQTPTATAGLGCTFDGRGKTLRAGTQSVFDRDGTLLFEGQWDPRLIASLLTGDDVDFWKGRKVLDCGANTGGLSVELARMGASVTAAEPDPHANTIAFTRGILEEIATREGLNLIVVDADLFSSHELGHHDVVLCLGLIYHFRYPQLLLDYLSSLRSDYLFLSCQTHPADDLALFNRAHPGILPDGFLPPDWNFRGGTPLDRSWNACCGGRVSWTLRHSPASGLTFRERHMVRLIPPTIARVWQPRSSPNSPSECSIRDRGVPELVFETTPRGAVRRPVRSCQAAQPPVRQASWRPRRPCGTRPAGRLPERAGCEPRRPARPDGQEPIETPSLRQQPGGAPQQGGDRCRGS
jgi:SAM-dependent methyltransferase